MDEMYKIQAMCPPIMSYFTDTMGEPPSGSPVCNDNWKVVALHKLSRCSKVTSFQGKDITY